MEYEYVDTDDEVLKCTYCKSVIDEKTNIGKKCKMPDVCYDEKGSSIRLSECVWGEV